MSPDPRASYEAGGASLVERFTRAVTGVVPRLCNDLPEDDGDLIVAEGVRHTLRLAGNVSLLMMECDPAYPYLIKLESIQRQYGLPGVDCVYHYAPLHGDHRYELRGNRGSARVFEIEVWRGHMSQLREWAFFSTTTRRFEPGEDLHICFSRETQDGDWLALPEGDCCILIRQYYYDWETEQPAHLQIEREHAVYPPPQLNLAEVERRIGQMETWLQEVTAGTRHMVQQYLDADPTRLAVVHIPFGFTRLRYLRGHYRCAPDQAVILEVQPPQARYWNFQLGNAQWEGLDYHLRHTAINGHQARLDADGVFRAVISQSDPGIANWLDTSGRHFGLISGRYFDADSAPSPTLRTVPLDSLAQHLPGDTPRVSPQQRQDIIRARMRSTVRRQCGD